MDSLKRIDLLKNWVSKKLQIDFSISTASSDASFRSYFRIKTLEDSFIVMDAPPQNESIESFLKIGKMLNSIEVNVPHIYLEHSYLLHLELGLSLKKHQSIHFEEVHP